MAKEMPAGREMDKAIGQHIFKYWVDHYDKDYAENCYYCLMDGSGDAVIPGFYGERKSEEEAWNDCPEFSTDIAAAWEVVERMPIPFKLEKCWEKAYQIGPEGWSACWCTDADCEGCNENSRCTNGDDAWAETAPLAICRCALKVAGVTEI